MSLQKLLGQNYKWWYILEYSYKQSTGNLKAWLFDNFLASIEFLVIVYIWVFNQATATTITYLALGFVYSRIVTSGFGGVLASYIVNGSITRDLLRPRNIISFYFLTNSGFNTVRFTISSMISFALAYIFFHQQIILTNFRPSTVAWLVLFLPVSLLSWYLFSFCVGCVGFWANERQSSNSVISGIYTFANILSGKMFPLGLIFIGSFGFLQYTPFAYTLHLPMQIYLGAFSNLQIFYVFLAGLGWCAVLYVLALNLFRLGLKKNESVGL